MATMMKRVQVWGLRKCISRQMSLSTVKVVGPTYMYHRKASVSCHQKMSGQCMCAIRSFSSRQTSCNKSIINTCVLTRKMSTDGENEQLTPNEYEKVADETLDYLSEFFDMLGDTETCPTEYDVEFSSGVLTVSFGKDHGTYVINKQSPNKQIWLSSPTSGPKRYDLVSSRWIYAHDGKALHDLLTEEISQILGTRIDVTEAEQQST